MGNADSSFRQSSLLSYQERDVTDAKVRGEVNADDLEEGIGLLSEQGTRKRMLELLDDPRTRPVGRKTMGDAVKRLRLQEEKTSMDTGNNDDEKDEEDEEEAKKQENRPCNSVKTMFRMLKIFYQQVKCTVFDLDVPDSSPLQVSSHFPLPVDMQRKLLMVPLIMAKLAAMFKTCTYGFCHRMWVNYYAAYIMPDMYHTDIPLNSQQSTIVFLGLCVSAGREDIIYSHFMRGASTLPLLLRARFVIHYALVVGRHGLAANLALAFFGANLHNDAHSRCRKASLLQQFDVPIRKRIPMASRGNLTVLNETDADSLVNVVNELMGTTVFMCFSSMWTNDVACSMAHRMDGIDLKHPTKRVPLLVRWFHQFILLDEDIWWRARPVKMNLSEEEVRMPTRPSTAMLINENTAHNSVGFVEHRTSRASVRVTAYSVSIRDHLDCKETLDPDVVRAPWDSFSPEQLLMAERLVADARDNDNNSSSDNQPRGGSGSLLNAADRKENRASESVRMQAALVSSCMQGSNLSVILQYSRSFIERKDANRFHALVLNRSEMREYKVDDQMFGMYLDDSSDTRNAVPLASSWALGLVRAQGSDPIAGFSRVPETCHFLKLKFLKEQDMEFEEFVTAFAFYTKMYPQTVAKVFEKLTPKQRTILVDVFGEEKVKLLEFILIDPGVRAYIENKKIVDLPPADPQEPEVTLGDLFDIPMPDVV